MTTYNTGNPVPSTEVKDLYDNAQTEDEFVNSDEAVTVTRTGKSIKTMAGMNADFELLLANSGYESTILVYGAGVVIQRQTQLVRYTDGELYRVKDPSTLPLTLTGTWATDAPKLTAVGDAALRTALASATGSSLVGFQRLQAANQIATLQGMLSAGTTINILEFANLAVGYTPNGDHTTWDWRPALQAAFDSADPGDTIFVPGYLDLRVVNATGTGADIVARRANAVANNTLKAVTCSTPNVCLHLDGRIRFTSPLDDGIRLSGANCLRWGRGTLQGISGEFLDTNPSGLPNPDLQQWYPSLLVMSGDGSASQGGVYIDAPTIALRLTGNRQYSLYEKFSGGPTSHGSGTLQFGIYCGLPVGGTSGHRVIGCEFRRSTGGGAAYSGVFSVSANSWIDGCSFYGMWEHGVYNYGADSKVLHNQVDGTGGGIAAGIQSFAPGFLADGNSVRNNVGGGISIAIADRAKIINNDLWDNIGVSAIAVRTFDNVSPAVITENIQITGNVAIVSGTSKQACIDVVLGNGFRNLKIKGNTCRGAPVPGSSGVQSAILVRCLPSSNNAGVNLDIVDNAIEECDGLAIVVYRVQGGKVTDNRIVNCNGSAGTVPVNILSSANIEFVRNTATELNRTPKCTSLLSATSGNLNSNIRAEQNNIINFAASTDPICIVPTDSFARGNSINSLPTMGFVTVPNLASNTVTAAGIRNAVSQVVLEAMGKTAVDLQAGANRMYVSAVAAGNFTVVTSSAAVPGANPVFKWEVYQ